MKKILFMNFGGIGDEILFLPTIKSVKDEFKNSSITLCLEKRSASISSVVPCIDKTITTDLKIKGFKKYIEALKLLSKIKKEKFDMVIASGKSPFIAIFLFLTGIKKRIGYKTKNQKTNSLLNFAVELNENQYAGKMYHDLIKPITDKEFQNPKINVIGEYEMDAELGEKLLREGFVAIHPGVSNMSISKNIYKCPSFGFWVELIDKLYDMGKNVVLLGGRDDYNIIHQISVRTDKFHNFYGKTQSFMDLIRIINKAEKFICVDSAPMHIGVALDKELIAIFGPTNEEKLLPKDSKFHIVHADADCRPCLWDKRKCNCKHSKCLNIKVEDVLKFV